MSLTRDEVIAYLEGLDTHALGELIDELQQRLGLQPVPPVSRGGMGASMVSGPTMGMQNPYSVVLVGYTESRRIEMMRVIREMRPVMITEARQMLDALPLEFGEFDYRGEAEALADRLRAAGGKVEVR